MRGIVENLGTPTPLIDTLPGIYQEDKLARAFVSAFDDELAPILSTIDNVAAYFDPALAPEDFLEWLAGWVGILPDETWPIERRRAVVALAAQLYRRRGTPAGLEMHLRLVAPGDIEVTDSGGTSWSTKPGSKPPGDGSYKVSVKITPPKKGQVDPARIEALVASAKPAHVVHEVTIASAPAK
jgi:phage tail-like protein